VQKEAIDIKSFELVDPSGKLLSAFTPGSHIDVHVRPGLIRQNDSLRFASEESTVGARFVNFRLQRTVSG
jgi:ferredoxin-NADP reductase